jgi:hypothetical protein
MRSETRRALVGFMVLLGAGAGAVDAQTGKYL